MQSTIHNSTAMFFLKPLRDWDPGLMFLRRMRCPLRQAARKDFQCLRYQVAHIRQGMFYYSAWTKGTRHDLIRLTKLGEFSPFGLLLAFRTFSKITKVAKFLGNFFPLWQCCINLNKIWVMLNFGRFFSQTHLVTLDLILASDSYLQCSLDLF
jgi:hypothetical protein